MDLLSIWTTLWRHKVAAGIIVVLTAVGATYVVAFVPPVYETDASLLLIAPPRAPTQAEVAADPTLKDIKTDNPYTRAYDAGIVINIVASVVSGDSSKKALEEKGADPDFSVGQTNQYGFSSPIAQIHATGKNADVAARTSSIVLEAFLDQLEELQSAEGVDPRYFITARVIEAPTPPHARSSDKLRALFAIAALGGLALFCLISTAEAIDRVRDKRREEEGDDETFEPLAARLSPHLSRDMEAADALLPQHPRHEPGKRTGFPVLRRSRR